MAKSSPSAAAMCMPDLRFTNTSQGASSNAWINVALRVAALRWAFTAVAITLVSYILVFIPIH
jgi:hypothetical protein